MVANMVRGVDHIGLTVSDVEVAHEFLIDGLGAQFLYELHAADDQPLTGPELESAIGLKPGSQLHVVRMYRLGDGPSIELFRYTAHSQQPPALASDLGYQHIALYVDDLEAAVARAVSAGGVQLAAPWDMIGVESGAGNRLCFVRAPFGALLEFVTCPSPQAYGAETDLKRWRPD